MYLFCQITKTSIHYLIYYLCFHLLSADFISNIYCWFIYLYLYLYLFITAVLTLFSLMFFRVFFLVCCLFFGYSCLFLFSVVVCCCCLCSFLCCCFGGINLTHILSTNTAMHFPTTDIPNQYLSHFSAMSTWTPCHLTVRARLISVNITLY